MTVSSGFHLLRWHGNRIGRGSRSCDPETDEGIFSR